MSELDVHQVICPTIERERDRLRTSLREAEAHVLELRQRIATHEPATPDPHDGTGWNEYLHP